MDAALDQNENNKKPTGVEQLENKNLSYQPQTKSSIYAHKTGIFDSTIGALQPILLATTAILTLFFIFFSINYFNVLPLSTSFPQIFGSLPHQYDVDSNKSALSEVPMNGDTGNYEITTQYYSNANNRVYIKFNRKIVEFVQDSQFSCFIKTTNKISNNQTEENILPAFCSDLLNSKNKSKNVLVDYTLDKTSGIYYVKSLTELN